MSARDLLRRNRPAVLVPDAKASQELGRGGPQIRKADGARNRLVGVDEPAGPVADGDPVRERAQDRLQLLTRLLERLQRRRLRLPATQHQADLIADRGHEVEHPLFDRPRVTGVKLDDRRHAVPLAHREGGDRAQPRRDRLAHPSARTGPGSSAARSAIQTASRPADALPAGSSPGFNTAARDASTTAARRMASSAQMARQSSTGRAPGAASARHPIHRQRPVELGGERPKDLRHRLVEGGRLQEDPRSRLLDRQQSRVVGMGTPAHRRHINDETRRCEPAT